MTQAANLAQVGSYAVSTGLPFSGASTLTSGTAQASTSGTSIDFTSIPAWVKRITVMFNQITSNSSNTNYTIQIGSGSVTTSGYTSQWSFGTNQSAVITNGFVIGSNGSSSTYAISGTATLTLINSNTWVCTSVTGFTNVTAYAYFSGGNSSALSGALDRIRFTSAAGTATFTAGTINILYE